MRGRMTAVSVSILVHAGIVAAFVVGLPQRNPPGAVDKGLQGIEVMLAAGGIAGAQAAEAPPEPPPPPPEPEPQVVTSPVTAPEVAEAPQPAHRPKPAPKPKPGVHEQPEARHVGKARVRTGN